MNRVLVTAIGIGAITGAPLYTARSPERSPAAPQGGCSGPTEWSEGRHSAERALKSGDAIAMGAAADPRLLEAVQEYWRARQVGDVSKLLELEISQSESHLAIEAGAMSKLLESDNAAKLTRPTPYSLWNDPTNAAHVWVYTTVVIQVGDHCIEDGATTEWVRLEGDWLTFPEGHFVTSAVKKGRPNRGYTPQ